MPDLHFKHVDEARALLVLLGVDEQHVYVDYQSRRKLGELFDEYRPNTVVSTLPRAGEVLVLGSIVVLGVRAEYDDTLPTDTPTPIPTRPPDPEPEEDPPTVTPTEVLATMIPTSEPTILPTPTRLPYPLVEP